MSSRVRQKAKQGLSRISDLLKGKGKREKTPKHCPHVPAAAAAEGNHRELNKCPTSDVFQPVWSSNPPVAPTSPIRTADLLRPLPPLSGSSSGPSHSTTGGAGAAASSQARKPAVRRRTVTVEDAEDDEEEVGGGGETEQAGYGAYHLVRERAQLVMPHKTNPGHSRPRKGRSSSTCMHVML